MVPWCRLQRAGCHAPLNHWEGAEGLHGRCIFLDIMEIIAAIGQVWQQDQRWSKEAETWLTVNYYELWLCSFHTLAYPTLFLYFTLSFSLYRSFFIFPFTLCDQWIYLSIHPSIHIHSLVHPSIHFSAHSFIHPSAYPSIHSFINLVTKKRRAPL